MLTETQKTRKAILRGTSSARGRKRVSPRVLAAIRHPFFPLGFLIRNILTLQEEPGWRHVSPRVWRGCLHRMLEERGRIFLEVHQWRSRKQRKEHSPIQALPLSLETSDQSGSCSHCGGCCEIASGFPDFPSEKDLPLRWQRIFGDGLGKGHRFCAFLWESDASGLSFCAIHPWRSNPCRTFAEDECAYLMNDLSEHPPYRPHDFSMACRRLARLINRR